MRKTFKKDMLNGNIKQQMLVFFFPLLLGYLLQQLYNTVDAIVVGKYVSTAALGAVGGTTGTTLNLLVNFIVSLSSGVTVIVAQYYGHSEYDKVNKSVRTGMFMAIASGFIMMVIGYLFIPSILTLLNVPNEIYDLSLLYIRVYLAGMIPQMIYNVGSSILRAIGDSKRPLYFLMVSCFSNIVLDLVFVRVFDMGVFGVALSTVVSQLISSILILLVLGLSTECYHFNLKEIECDITLLKKAVGIGLPAGLQSVVYSISNLFIQSTVNSFGNTTVAAYTAFGKIDGFYWNYDSAFAITVLTMVGQNYGAGNSDRVKKTIKDAIFMGAIATIFISSITYFFAPQLIGLFTDEAAVIEIGVSVLRFISPAWILFLLIEVFSSTLKGCGTTLIPMIISATCICGVRIAYLKIYEYKNLIEALYCYPISWFITSIAFVLYYKFGKWNKKVI